MDLTLGYTRLIIETCAENGLSLPQAAYVLGTAYHESGHTMRPVRETMASTTDKAIAILDREWEKPGSVYYKGRGTVATPYWRRDKDGKSWLGRGIAQITLKGNYEAWSKRLGVDLVADPEKAMDPKLGAYMLAVGMKKGWWRAGHTLDRYINAQTIDYKGARQTVNGYISGVAETIARYAQSYQLDLERIGYTPKKTTPATVPAAVGAAGGAVAVAVPDLAPYIIGAVLVALVAWFILRKVK